MDEQGTPIKNTIYENESKNKTVAVEVKILHFFPHSFSEEGCCSVIVTIFLLLIGQKVRNCLTAFCYRTLSYVFVARLRES